ncbi:MAG: hypothetical protein A2776_00490 [Candidatus Levybacteria bacterium RIFCSPHIGHO2_01_FULL_40_10]|nr:MAG: hypothetical protein A2776_00490 [Candidatus Levybacteria bacterium RIFCSPHIGHO2_01_FULL_40_10]
MNITPFIFLAASYLIGSFPTAYLVVKAATGKDIRLEETGNVGAMNTARATGKIYLFLLVFIVDATKGYLGVFLPYLFIASDSNLIFTVTLSSFGIVLGHCYSVYFKIKDGKFAGGKAIASLSGILFGISFTRLLAPWGAAMIIPLILSGNMFLAQFSGTVALPFIGYFLFPEYFLMTVLCAIPIFIKQWPRVIPMLQGREPKWYFKKRKK